jgi:ribosomal-protein-alanine N-acetyltransferase
MCFDQAALRGREGVVKVINPHPELTTERLRLRSFAPQDVDGLHDCFGDPYAMRYWDSLPCRSKAETHLWMMTLAKTIKPFDHLAWAVADKVGDRCIGMVNYHHREVRNERLEISYILAPEWHGRGLMTEAVRALLVYCFCELGVHRVEALIDPENFPSIRLAGRLGFRCEGGPLRDRWRAGDGYRSVMMYGLIAGELVGDDNSVTDERRK